jgi:hypothetical protein
MEKLRWKSSLAIVVSLVFETSPPYTREFGTGKIPPRTESH